MLKRYFIYIFLFFFKITLFSLDNAAETTQNDLEKWLENSKTSLNQDLFYNIGIYYSSMTNHGKAILYLKKAYLLSHNDRKIKEALDNERKKLELQVFLHEPSIIEKIIAFPFNFAPLNFLLILGILLYSAGCIIIFFNLFRLKKLEFINKIFPDRKVIITGIILLLAGITYLCVGIFKYRIIFNKNEAVIINDSAIFDRPETNSIEISKVSAGTECKILSQEGEYHLVNTISGKEGYIITNTVERLW